MNQQKRDPKSALVICLLLLLVPLAAFWPVRQHDFVNYDDQDYVTENARVQNGLSRQNLAWACKTTVSGNWHPLTVLSHMLDCQLYGLNAGLHHLTSLGLHLANTLLLFWVLRRMTGTMWRSAVVAALFAIHPLHVESVAWISERKDVLSMLFFLLTLWAYTRYVKAKAESRQAQEVSSVDTPARSRHFPCSIFYLLALGFFAFGLMSKPMVVTLPFVLLLLDYWPLDRVTSVSYQVSGGGIPLPVRERIACFLRLLFEKLPFFLLSAVFSVITFRAQQGGGAVATTDLFPLHLRVGNALISYVRYLRKTVWPDDLAVFYPHPGVWPVWQVVGAGLFLTLITIAVFRFGRSRPYLPVGWLWFVGTLIPVIGLVQVGMQAMADRYTYLPLVGVFVMLVWLGADLVAADPRRASWLWPITVVIAVGCFVATRAQLRHWKNDEALFSRAVRVTRDNDIAHNGLGVAFFRQGKLDAAAAEFEKAIRIRPNKAQAYNNLGGVRVEQGRLEEALGHLHQALQLNPNHIGAHNNLGLTLKKLGRTSEAVTQFEASLRLNPEQTEALNDLGNAAFNTGKFEAAAAHYAAALRVKPHSVESHQNLGWRWPRRVGPTKQSPNTRRRCASKRICR